MLLKLIYLSIWILYTFLEGRRDASYYHTRITSSDPDKENIHWIYFSQRFIVGILIGMSMAYNSRTIFGLIEIILLLTGLVLIFSFIHNSVYQIWRHKLNKDVYPNGWRDTSTSSTAFLDFSFQSRLIQFIIGIILISLSFIL